MIKPILITKICFLNLFHLNILYKLFKNLIIIIFIYLNIIINFLIIFILILKKDNIYSII